MPNLQKKSNGFYNKNLLEKIYKNKSFYGKHTRNLRLERRLELSQELPMPGKERRAPVGARRAVRIVNERVQVPDGGVVDVLLLEAVHREVHVRALFVAQHSVLFPGDLRLVVLWYGARRSLKERIQELRN